MRKSGLSAAQTKQRDEFVKLLSRAGWAEGIENKAFDSGKPLDCEATMEFAHDDVELILEYCASRRAIDFSLEDSRGRGIVLRLPVGSSVAKVVDLFTGMQDVVSVSNFQEHANEIVRVVPDAVILLEDDTIPLARHQAK